MFKWFAPLLIFAGKPDVLIRVATAVIAAAILAFGVWLLSNIAVTFDTLKNPYIAAVYGIVLFCFFCGVGTVTWLRLRRRSPAERLTAPLAAETPLPNEIVRQRAEVISRQWESGKTRAQKTGRVAVVPPAPALPEQKPAAARASLMVTGPAYTGKTTLIDGLRRATSAATADTSDVVKLIDAGPVDGDERHLAGLVAAAAETSGVLFVVDQDLRAPEVAAIKRLVAAGKPLYLVLNKADQFTAADRDAILVSIRAKMPATFAPGHVVSAAASPSPVEREIEDARGTVRIELRQPASDLRSLTNLLSRLFPPASGRSLQFVAA